MRGRKGTEKRKRTEHHVLKKLVSENVVFETNEEVFFSGEKLRSKFCSDNTTTFTEMDTNVNDELLSLVERGLV